MPSSTWAHTSTIQDLFWKYQPKSLLDIGVGFGRWGMLCREQMDIFCGRLHKNDWKTRIVGVEIFPQYIQSHQHWLYDNVKIVDALDFLKSNGERFDVVIAGDVVEHFPQNLAYTLMDECYKVANKAAIFCIPFGPGYKQGAAFGNEAERHVSQWVPEDFKNDNRVTKVTVVKERIKLRPYGIVLMEK